MLIQIVQAPWISAQLRRARILAERPKAVSRRGPYRPKSGIATKRMHVLFTEMGADHLKDGKPASAAYVLGVLHGNIMHRQLASKNELLVVVAACI